MSGWPLYRVHKWFAVTVGVFLLVWLISGIIMILPPISPGPDPVRQVPAVNYREITLSPAQAVEMLEKTLGTAIEANQVSLRRIRDIVAYEIRSRNGGPYLIDAMSGEKFSITRDLAERFVRDTYPSEGRVVKVETVEHYSYAYQWGPLPTYRVVLDSDPSVDYYVPENDGTVRRSDRWNRLRGALESFHTFQPIKLIINQDMLRKSLLVMTGIIGIAAAITGYYLALRRR